MRLSNLFCPINEQSKLPSRLNDCEQNKYSLNMLSNFRDNTQGSPERLKKGQWSKKTSPEESGKDHRIVNIQLPQSGCRRPGSPRHPQVTVPLQAEEGWVLCKQQSPLLTHAEPQGLSYVLANFPRLSHKLLPSPCLLRPSREHGAR